MIWKREKDYRNLIFDWLIKENQENDKKPKENENYKMFADTCVYSLIKDYTPDCPGWCGDIITIVFGYDSCIYNFRIIDDKLEEIIPEK